MKNFKQLTKKEKGFVLISGAMMLMFVLPVVGLAVDAGMLFAVKARLQAATDAASLAAARSLAVGLTLAEQEDSANARAAAFFAANFPTGLLASTNPHVTSSVAENGFRTRTVTVSATVDAPLYFMRLLVNAPTTTVAAIGKASRRDVNVIMVIDRSGSMNSNGGCTGIVSAANGFVNVFANLRDRLGLITYGISYALSYAPNMAFKSSSPSLPGVINTITCSGGTGSPQGLFQGYSQLATINEPGALNVILWFSDGIPNTITADFPVNILDTTRVATGPTGATISLASATVKNSRCYDWQNGQRWTRNSPNLGLQNAAWIPNTEVFRGAFYSQVGYSSGNSTFGVVPYIASGFTDPSGVVSYPYPTAGSSTAYTTPANTQDCWFQGGKGHNGSSQGTGSSQASYDVAYIPDNDIYGTANSSADNFVTVNRFPGGHPYAGKIDIRNATNIMNATVATTDNMGKRIRNRDLNAGINTVVYAIGLGADVQQTLMQRVANDSASPIYDNTKLEGLYVYAPTASDLNEAFVKIASEILRVSQ